ncbi:MAG: type II toxin-antitoxin system RelE/ParE family toxin [Thermoanaerobaculia bacterium]
MRWSQEALRWLKEIHDYIAQDNPEAARRTAAGIVDRVEVLATFPQIGQRHEGRPDREVRILLYGHYRIAYLVTAEKDVQLLGIFHDALDIERYLA